MPFGTLGALSTDENITFGVASVVLHAVKVDEIVTRVTELHVDDRFALGLVGSTHFGDLFEAWISL